MIIRMQGNTHLQTDSPQWTTALVCSEVPDAILVSAQAASNCNGGLKQQHKQDDNTNKMTTQKTSVGGFEQ